MLKTLKQIFRERGSLWAFLLGSGSLFLLLIFFQTRTVSLDAFFRMAADGSYGAFGLLYAVTYMILVVVVALLFGLAVTTLNWQFQHSKLKGVKKLKGLKEVFGGGAAGALATGCPVCGAFVLGLFGVSSGLAIFPLRGLELQFLSVILVGLSVFLGLRHVRKTLDEGCDTCVLSSSEHKRNATPLKTSQILTIILVAVLVLNQWMIGGVSTAFGGNSSLASVGKILQPAGETSKTIIMPILNDDGKTTRLETMPTITDVPGEPKGDPIEAAKTVMLATGTPFYAPEGITFDDPVAALTAWGRYEKMSISSEMESRYKEITNQFTCNFCCGSPTRVAVSARCGCAHAKAGRGFFRYMLETYGDEYSNEQLMGEAYRWQAAWYPSGVVEDYLLATGRGDVLGHSSHGGAGTDGRHGL